MGEETGAHLIADLSRAQQLLEVLEAGGITARSAGDSRESGESAQQRGVSEESRERSVSEEGRKSGVDRLLDKWRSRLEGCTKTSLLGEAPMPRELPADTLQLFPLFCFVSFYFVLDSILFFSFLLSSFFSRVNFFCFFFILFYSCIYIISFCISVCL